VSVENKASVQKDQNTSLQEFKIPKKAKPTSGHTYYKENITCSAHYVALPPAGGDVKMAETTTNQLQQLKKTRNLLEDQIFLSASLSQQQRFQQHLDGINVQIDEIGKKNVYYCVQIIITLILTLSKILFFTKPEN